MADETDDTDNQEASSPQEEAFDYRRQGASYFEIAKAMSLEVSEVIELVSEYIKGIASDNPYNSKKIDLERVELMMNGIFQAASSGDTESINMVLRLMAERKRIEKEIAEMSLNTNRDPYGNPFFIGS